VLRVLSPGQVAQPIRQLSLSTQHLEALSPNRVSVMSDDNPLAIDVDKRTTRGRLCPQCGGKIIPSNRAVYQSTGDPNAVFAIWQCERCGYEEMSERPKPAGKAKH